MESIFVTENPIDLNLFENECNEVQKLRIGEIFQLKDNSLSICCIHCSQEFFFFTEFSLHTQEHFLHGEIGQLKECDSIKSHEKKVSQSENVFDQNRLHVKFETVTNEIEYFDRELGLDDGWTEEEYTERHHTISEPEINMKSVENSPATPSFIEGNDYVKTNNKFQCLKCSHEASRWECLRIHLLTHSDERNVVCPICSKTFSAVSYVRKHVNRTHKMKISADKIREAQPTFGAPIIDHPVKPVETKSFVEGKDYEKKNGRFQCLTCGRKMLDHIKEHLLTHSNDKDVFCPICEKSFIAVSYVRKHVNRAHKMRITADEIKSAQSSIQVPNKKEPNQSHTAAVVLHRSSGENLEKNFECFHCHRQFKSLSSLRIHLKLHSGIKYACPHCDKIFAMRSYVRDHIVVMHGIKREEIPKDSIQPAIGLVTVDTKPIIGLFECNLCKKQYTKKKTLRQHMKVHASGTFLCVICGVIYKSIANLRYHMERHQSDPKKRFQCNECEKTYPTRRYMLSHHRTIHRNNAKKKPKKKKETNCNQDAEPKFLI